MPSKKRKSPKRPAVGKMPHGYPPLASMMDYVTPERLAFIKKNPDHAEFVRKLSAQFARDPVFLANVEAMLKQGGAQAQLERNTAALLEIASFGWEPAVELPSPKHAAAAVGAAAAALVVPVAV